MAEKHRTFDVWIVETNTVYRQVPYTAVADWAQQGRLLEDDRVRPSGTEPWFTLGEVPAFAAFLPHAEAHRAEDQAEALEPVQAEVTWRSRRAQEDDDVDMIPLIDVSLVLLIFFMMTATVGALSEINTPEAQYLLLNVNPESFWIGVEPGKPDAAGKPRYNYSLGHGEGGAATRFKDQYGPAEVLKKLDEELSRQPRPVQLRVRGDHRVPCEIVTDDLRSELGKRKTLGKIDKLFIEVSEKKP